MTDKERINELKKFTGLNFSRLASEIGIKTVQTLYDIKNGRHGISKELAEKIQARYLDINIAWLLTGEGEMLKQPTGNTVTVGTAQQSTVVGGNYYGANTRTHTHAKGGDVHLIPVIPRNLYDETDIDTLEYISENKEELQFSPQVMQFPTFAVFYNVYDDEMLPRFKPGDKLAINPYQQGQEDSIIDGRPYVVDTYSNGLILRKVYKMADGALKLVADNENYRDEIIPRSDVIRVFRVLGLLRNNP